MAESRARLHAHSEVERTLRAQLEAARAQAARGERGGSGGRARRDAACDPVRCDAEDCQLRLEAGQEISTDANELAAEVGSVVLSLKVVNQFVTIFYLNLLCCFAGAIPTGGDRAEASRDGVVA